MPVIDKEPEFSLIVFKICEEELAVEVNNSCKCFELINADIAEEEEKPVLRFQGRVLSLIDIRRFLKSSDSESDQSKSVFVLEGNRAKQLSQIGFIVDSISGKLSKEELDLCDELNGPSVVPKAYLKRILSYKGRKISVLNIFRVPV